MVYGVAIAVLRVWGVLGVWGPTVNPRKLEHGFRRICARIPILYLKGMRILMFQLSGFYYKSSALTQDVWGYTYPNHK